MTKKADKLIKSMLGKDFFEVLEKSDVYKMNNKVVTSIDELKTGLSIVPRTVMSFLIANLSGLEKDQNKNLELPFAENNYLQVTKKGPDIFTGHIYCDGKKINEFQDTSIPGIGLVLMTTFELYEVENIKESRVEEEKTFDVDKLQRVIDERLRLHSLVCSIVDKKMAQRDAVEILIKEKIKQALVQKEVKAEEEVVEETKSEKLKRFLEKQKETKSDVEIEKKESISCPDCGSDMYKGGSKLTLCICYGADWNKNIKIKKSEKNIKMSFPKSMDRQNIELLLQNLKIINKD